MRNSLDGTFTLSFFILPSLCSFILYLFTSNTYSASNLFCVLRLHTRRLCIPRVPFLLESEICEKSQCKMKRTPIDGLIRRQRMCPTLGAELEGSISKKDVWWVPDVLSHRGRLGGEQWVTGAFHFLWEARRERPTWRRSKIPRLSSLDKRTAKSHHHLPSHVCVWSSEQHRAGTGCLCHAPLKSHVHVQNECLLFLNTGFSQTLQMNGFLECKEAGYLDSLVHLNTRGKPSPYG